MATPTILFQRRSVTRSSSKYCPRSLASSLKARLATHIRGHSVQGPGPKPLRSAQWPRGLPGLPPAAVARVKNANILSDFAVKILQAAGEAGSISLLEPPEDLGPSRLGTPASLWQRSDMKDLSKWGYARGALYQSDWAPVPYRKPTGLITTAKSIAEDQDFFVGWPRFTSSGSYAGPLHPRPGGGPLIGKNAAGESKTTPTAAYPPAMSSSSSGNCSSVG